MSRGQGWSAAPMAFAVLVVLGGGCSHVAGSAPGVDASVDVPVDASMDASVDVVIEDVAMEGVVMDVPPGCDLAGRWCFRANYGGW